MNLSRFVFWIACWICAITAISFGVQNKENKAKEAELAALRQTLDVTRDSLQNDIAQRWRAKQQFV